MPSNMQQTCKLVRERLGLDKSQMADALQVPLEYYDRFECRWKNAAGLPQKAIERFREKHGVDLHVADWVFHGYVDDLPPAMRWTANKLTETWEKELREKLGMKEIKE